MAMPSSDTCLRVVLLHQHALIRGALRLLLETQPQVTVVGDAVPGPRAVAMVAQQQPDIILLNLLQQADALELIPPLLTAAQHAPLLVMTEAQDRELHRQAVQLGARGVVHIDQPPEMLLAAITKVHAGELWTNQQVLTQVLAQLVQERGDPQKQAALRKVATLTQREREIIGLVAMGLRNQEIAQRLWVVESTVRHHLTSIFGKLDVANRAALIVYAYRYGLVTRPS